MKFYTSSHFFKIVLAFTVFAFSGHAIAQTLMKATAKDGTILSFTMPKDIGENTELSILNPKKRLKKYLVYMPLTGGQIQFHESVLCQRNCANAKAATPGLPLKGGYQSANNELRCTTNCRGIESGLTFAEKR
jgi:hypothetical protein